MTRRIGYTKEEISAAAGRLGLSVTWDLLVPTLCGEGRWDLEATIAANRRAADQEQDWAITDQVNASSTGYFPRDMGHAERSSWGAVIHRRAQGQLERAEEKARSVRRLEQVLAALAGEGG